MNREDAILLIKSMLLHSVGKSKWTDCPRFHCVHNTGWAAGENKYKCKLGNEKAKCKAGR